MRKKPSSAENQQERSKEFWRGYVTGLIDSEGCFHVAFQRRKDLPLGISIIPEFQISQDERSKKALEKVQLILGCGYIKPNHRHSNDKTLVYIVRDRIDLLTKVISFLEVSPLQTEKRNDFQLFRQIVEAMNQGNHRIRQGVEKIIILAYKMNGGGKRRKISLSKLLTLLKSPETTRKTRAKG